MSDQTVEQLRKEKEEMQKAVLKTVETMQEVIQQLHDRHVALMRECLKHLQPQRYQYPWELEQLKQQRENLIEALQTYIDNEGDLNGSH